MQGRRSKSFFCPQVSVVCLALHPGVPGVPHSLRFTERTAHRSPLTTSHPMGHRISRNPWPQPSSVHLAAAPLTWHHAPTLGSWLFHPFQIEEPC